MIQFVTFHIIVYDSLTFGNLSLKGPDVHVYTCTFTSGSVISNSLALIEFVQSANTFLKF